MLCIDRLGDMALVGDIIEYENYMESGDDDIVVVGALFVIGVAIELFAPVWVNRLRGGEGEIIVPPLRGSSGWPMIPEEFLREGAQMTYDAAGNVVGFIWNKTKSAFNRTRSTNSTRGNSTRVERPLRGGSSGAAMLAWKNSLTRMYHTYQVYMMHPALWCTTVNTFSLHRTRPGDGPCLYWTMSQVIGAEEGRNGNFANLNYWDGGMSANPTAQVNASPGPPPVAFVPKKNFGLGANGIVYVFSADWPGTIMNPDPDTYNSTDTYKQLEWSDYEYQGTTTTPNIPRTWVSAFNNTSWQYITTYGTQYRFDLTNYSVNNYTVEISLFKFKADVDAMNYERQCLAHFGGYHFNMNAYAHNLAAIPASDVSIIKTRRYQIPGNKTYINVGEFMEGPNKKNNRTVRWNIKKRNVIKRPQLNSYQTDMTEKTVFQTYFEAQKSLYFRVMAFPEDPIFGTKVDGVIGTFTNTCTPRETNGQLPTILSNGIGCTIWRKTYFKMDQNTATY